MLFTSPVLLPDVFQDVNGFLKTLFPPGKHTLHLLDSCKELKAVKFPDNSISTRGWVNPIKSKGQMKKGEESGDPGHFQNPSATFKSFPKLDSCLCPS